MESIIFLIAGTLAYKYSSSAKRTQKQLTQKTYPLNPLFSSPYTINSITTKNGDVMHLGECNENGVTYGSICIELNEAFTYLHEAQKVLENFINSLHPSFAIQHTTGFSREVSRNAAIEEWVDYWQDAESRDWKVKGWTNGITMTVLYVCNISQAPTAKQESFLNDFHFIAG